MAVDSTVIQAIIAAVSAVIVALISLWGIMYQRTGKLLWWIKPNPSPSKPPTGHHDSQLSDAYDLAVKGTTLNNIGGVYHARGQYDQALQNYQQALVIARDVGYGALEEAVRANIESLSDD
jgi:hypothetical protein